jgi:hypothetical protein
VPDGDINADSAHSGIVPLYIGPMPSNGIPYSTVILDVAPDEFARIKMPEPKLSAELDDRQRLTPIAPRFGPPKFPSAAQHHRMPGLWH